MLLGVTNLQIITTNYNSTFEFPLALQRDLAPFALLFWVTATKCSVLLCYALITIWADAWLISEQDNPSQCRCICLSKCSTKLICAPLMDIEVCWFPRPTFRMMCLNVHVSMIWTHGDLNECENMPLVPQPCRMKPVNVPDINLLPTLLSSARTIGWRQGLELLVGMISLMHTSCRWAWHFNQTCTSLKLTVVVNNLINLFCWDASYHCQVRCLNVWASDTDSALILWIF